MRNAMYEYFENIRSHYKVLCNQAQLQNHLYIEQMFEDGLISIDEKIMLNKYNQKYPANKG